MRLGLIARADSRGLGIQTKAFHDQMRPAKTMVIDCPSMKPLPIRRNWYPGATWIKGWPTRDHFRVWLQDLDMVYTAETGYSPDLWHEAERMGVRTVLHANYEFLNRSDRPSLWAAPSLWHFDDFPTPKLHLPLPIETDRLTVRRMPEKATHFLHLIGRPAHMDRNGTTDLLKALAFVESSITVTVRCQEPGYVSGLIRKHDIRTPGNVTLVVDSGDVENYWTLYDQGHVLVLPRRFGGLCLPAQEAVGSGMPCIMTDIDPNNTWLPGEWLAPARHRGSFMAKQRVDYYSADHRELAALIDRFASEPGFYTKAVSEAVRLRNELSWEQLRPEYERVLSSV